MSRSQAGSLRGPGPVRQRPNQEGETAVQAEPRRVLIPSMVNLKIRGKIFVMKVACSASAAGTGGFHSRAEGAESACCLA